VTWSWWRVALLISVVVLLAIVGWVFWIFERDIRASRKRRAEREGDIS
jgi:hypothetical protein